MPSKGLSSNVGLMIYFLCVAITFIFVTASTPIAQFKAQRFETFPGFNVTRLSCITYWGLKVDCSSASYARRHDESIPCEHSTFLHVMQVAAGFAVLSIFFTLFSCISCGMALCGVHTPKPTIGLAVVCVLVTLVPWICMSGVSFDGSCRGVIDVKCHGLWTYGGGYILFVMAWCIHCIEILALIAF